MLEQAGSNLSHQGPAFAYVCDLVSSGWAVGSRSLSRGKGKFRRRGLESEALLVVASSYRGYDVGGGLLRGSGRKFAWQWIEAETEMIAGRLEILGGRVEC